MDVLPLPSAEELPTCNACHTAPVTNRGYSTCLPCRDKRNEQSRRATQRKRERKMQAGKSAGKKRKASADGEKSADVLERMRKRFKKMEPFTTVETSAAADAASSEFAFEKFVSSKDLHKAIKRRYADTRNSLRFYGTYAIIADPEIDNKLRARRVARDLRDNTTLHFNLEDKEEYRDDTAYTTHFKCTCRSSLKRTASDISSYFGSNPKAASSNETPMSECRGRIEIRTEDDESHRLGWPGQRIKVTVTHPKKM
ncbi:hypothetical protein K438DRAFT_1858641 [Mycena galopus ATCC 62051]|nr:hypothetical protein K438DRAFT_1858641 [Mycena galopus ATCC 62051]